MTTRTLLIEVDVDNPVGTLLTLRFSRYEILGEVLLKSGCHCSVERVRKRASAWLECASACAN